jgi:glycine dehydrogenase subunit 1
MQARAARDGQPLCFIGAGAYEHHIPAAVWEITTRGEFYSAYTPYQAEASQGTLQLLYEFQTMMTRLTGAWTCPTPRCTTAPPALAEAVLMAVRANRKSKSKRILMPVPCIRCTARWPQHRGQPGHRTGGAAVRPGRGM